MPTPYQARVTVAAGIFFLSMLVPVKTVAAPGFTVLAGSGALGIHDGPSATATFVQPLGIASDGHGGLIVADAGAQRIRHVSIAGTVTTLAGGGALSGLRLEVPGGYVDGPALQARFDHPSAVIMRKDGGILIADTRNHVIRLLKDGIVSTYAGRKDSITGAVGPLSVATFSYPRGFAYDAQGTLYVADWSQGLRAISPDGIVSTIALPPLIGVNLITVSAQPGPTGGSVLFVSNGVETYVYDTLLKSAALYSHDPNDNLPGGLQGNIEGGDGSGNPVTIAAISPDEFVYTDSERDSIRYVHERYDSIVPLPPGATLQSPIGLLPLPDGRLAVSDAGNRRIVAIPGPDRRYYQLPIGFPPPIPPKSYRISVLGNSYVYYDVAFRDSMETQVKTRLEADEGRKFDVLPIRFGPFSGVRDYVDQVLASGLTDTVVLVVEANTMYISYNVPYWSDLSTERPLWEARFESDLKSIAASLEAAHIPLVILTHPVASDVGPNERVAGFQREGGLVDTGASGDSERSIVEVVDRLHLPCTLDLTPEFVARERATPHVRLFENADFHFSPAGNALVASELSKLLERCAPWRTSAEGSRK